MRLSSHILAFHRRICDPAQRGPALAVCRAALNVPAALYGWAAARRNRPYDVGAKRGHRCGVPVISVGNITAGGTGKTPFAAWVAGRLRSAGRRPAVLSRGYGADAASGLDDENQLLAALAPGVPIVVDPDRVAGAARAVKEHRADVLVLDDGFQHRRIARDLDIVLVDALDPFGGGYVLPRGLLREPMSGLARAGLIVITRADQVSADRMREVRSRLAECAPGVPVALAVHRPTGLRALAAATGAQTASLDDLRTGRWAAFCGLGNPEGFRRTLEGLGADVARFDAFPDHYRYTPRDVVLLVAEAHRAGCRGVITTEKDAIKVERLMPADASLPVLALQVQMEITEGREEVDAKIMAAALNEG